MKDLPDSLVQFSRKPALLEAGEKNGLFVFDVRERLEDIYTCKIAQLLTDEI